MYNENRKGDEKMKMYVRIISAILCLLMAVSLAGCGKKSDDAEFIGTQWTRTTEYDTEYLCFKEDGSFSYYCACGEPQNDSDLIESYSYDKEKGTVTFDTIGKTDSMVTEIKVLEYDSEHIKLDFDGDIREFTVEGE